MKKNDTPNNSIKKYTIMVLVFVISIVLIGVSLSYAYFSARFSGRTSVDKSTAGNFNVTSTLTTEKVINSNKLAIIEESDYKEKSEKIAFSVTNESDSNLDAKYTVKIVEMSLTKNLFSEYFKWELVVNEGTENEKVFNGTFEDATVTPEGTSDTSFVNDLSKILITEEEALTLNVGETDNLNFYIWLQNDENVNQLYLTEGTFRGKISLDAIPTKN